MALEDLTGPDKFINALVPDNPTSGDPKSQGDDHIRGVKNVLVNTFPNLDAEVTATAAELNQVVSPQVFVPLGACIWWPTGAPPLAYLLCQGQLLDRVAYAALFAVLGTTWGAGDGSTTFGIPDLQGRVPEGSGFGAGGPGTYRGADERTLAAANIPQLSTEYSRTDYAGQRAEARGDGYFIYNTYSTQPLTVGSATPTGVNIVARRASGSWIIRAF